MEAHSFRCVCPTLSFDIESVLYTSKNYGKFEKLKICDLLQQTLNHEKIMSALFDKFCLEITCNTRIPCVVQ